MTDPQSERSELDRRLLLLLEQARDLPRMQRQSFLEAECGEDRDLLRRLLEILKTREETSDLLRHAAPDSVNLAQDLAEGDLEAWDRFIAQVRSRGPAFTRYEVEAEMARGGMGLIRRVRDRDLRRSLAMKVMLVHPQEEEFHGSQSASLGRFLEEAQITSQLDHPGIVPVHEVGLDDESRIYFTMKLVKGDDLRTVFDLVRAGEQGWSRTRALHLLLKVCEAMTYAHAKGVIHRDLKPANIMVGRYGETYVMDWGLAKILGRGDKKDIRLQPVVMMSSRVKSERVGSSELPADSPLVTMDGDVVGTPAYMSPEQAEGRLNEVGPQSDVFAMGAMLYHLLTGQMPYMRPGIRMSHHTMLAMVLQGPPPPLNELADDVPAELEAICDKAMARELSGRYRTMGELAEDLRAYLEHRVVQAYETGTLAELKKWISRNQGLTATVAAALVVIAVLTTWFVLSVQEKEAKATRSAIQARQNEEKALDEKARADRAAEELGRLSDGQVLSDLKNQMNAMWPARDERIPEMQEWLRQARLLMARLPDHEQTLNRLREQGRSIEHPRAEELRTLEETEARVSAVLETDLTPQLRESHEHRLDGTRREVVELRKLIQAESPHEFDDARLSWWHQTLATLVSDLTALGAEDPHGETIANVERRLEIARNIRAWSIDQYRDEWDEALFEISDPGVCPAYGGLEIGEQVGLVPIGRDPSSGLFEFWHVESGEMPVRDDTGELVIDPGSGMVFVLIPGDTFLMGSQPLDEDGSNYDPAALNTEYTSETRPVPVTLAPFFLSKFETTQGQWERLTGKAPSEHGPGQAYGQLVTRCHPVERVSWNDCAELARRRSLLIPTEAQWEYACRAGTDSVYHSGDVVESLGGFANIRGEEARVLGTEAAFEPGFRDDWIVHAPVGAGAPNDFGLHDMHGNLWEWTRCVDHTYNEPFLPGDGARPSPSIERRIFRGGSYFTAAVEVRSANRRVASPALFGAMLGIRFSRSLDS